MERRWKFGVIWDSTAKPVAKTRLAALAGKIKRV
jgi:hypothetical protein